MVRLFSFPDQGYISRKPPRLSLKQSKTLSHFEKYYVSLHRCVRGNVPGDATSTAVHLVARMKFAEKQSVRFV